MCGKPKEYGMSLKSQLALIADARPQTQQPTKVIRIGTDVKSVNAFIAQVNKTFPNITTRDEVVKGGGKAADGSNSIVLAAELDSPDGSGFITAYHSGKVTLTGACVKLADAMAS